MPQPIPVIRKLEPHDLPACETILYSLPDWFGIEAANQAYVESLRHLPAVVTTLNDEIVGFLALTEHHPQSYEIHVMAVSEAHHRQGVGRALVYWAESFCQEAGVDWLHVKTLGPSTPDEAYGRTRQFYLAMGFTPLFESLTLLGAENAALILVKHLTCFPVHPQT